MRIKPAGLTPTARAPVCQWLAEPLPADVRNALDRLAAAEDVRHVAVMPDVHLSHEVCVGTVIATRRLIYPNAVGGDIGCGMAAVALDCHAEAIAGAAEATRLFAALYQAVPLNRQPRAAPLPAALQDAPLSDPRLEVLKRRDGRVQFGTLGRGNHFVEFQADEEGRLWLMAHTGSRAVGQAVRDLHLTRAGKSAGGLHWLDAQTPEGEAYLSDADWARRYADASRRAILQAVGQVMASLFNVRMLDDTLITCDHNHVRRETHFGEALWVHRKGATSAAADEPGVIPGSMGSASYHVEGRGHPDALCSSSHGAGRAMSRQETRSVVSARRLRDELAGVWFDPRMAERLRDEAPSAYKDVAAVMRAQRDLTRIIRKLRPVLSYKGG